MQLSPLLYSLTASTASATLQTATDVVRGVGRGFAAVLGQETAVVEQSAEPLTLEGLASKFQDWLKDNGLLGDFKLHYSLDSGGRTAWSTDGQEAAGVERLLATNPRWLDNLKQVATNLQWQANQRDPSSLPKISLRISDQSWAVAAYG